MFLIKAYFCSVTIFEAVATLVNFRNGRRERASSIKEWFMKEMDMIKDIVRAYRNYPDYVAFVIDDTSYTYQEVFARVQGIMPFVQDCPEDIIGIIAEDYIETYASILAVLLAEKTYVILHPNYPDSRNRTIVESTGMKQVLYGHESGTRQGLPCLLYTSDAADE